MDKVTATERPDRKAAICDAALGVFAQYGFRRTSMEDIARAAGMSRPALYLYFRNKEDLARHLATLFYDRAVRDVEAALAQPGTAEDVLLRAFRAKTGPHWAQMLASPHGAELIALGNSLSADIAAGGAARLRDQFSAWLDRGRAAGTLAFEGPPEAMAATLLAAFDGITSQRDGFDRHRARLAALMGRALTP